MTKPTAANKTPPSSDFGDFVQNFQIEDLDIRGRMVRLGDSFQAAIAAHNYPEPLARLIGETMVLTAVLATALKFDGVFSLQAQGDGPVSLVMADVTSDGAMRAYAKLKSGTTFESIDGVSIPQMMGAGYMALTVDQGPDTERYQGITELNGATLADCAHNYFHQSEQLETAIAIVSGFDPKTGAPRAAGLMVQRLPSEGDGAAEDENWRRAVILMSSIKAEELLDDALSASQILYRLYHEDGVRLYDQRVLRHECRCSESRVQRTLLSFPKADIVDMAEDGKISVTCEFCGTGYVYDTQRLDALYRDAQQEK